MPVTCRPARPEDLESAVRVVQIAVNDLRVRHGLAPTQPLRPPLFQKFCLSMDPDGLWVAADGEEIAGFGFSWMAQDFWYLSQLFVAPGRQGKGIGQTLLAHTLRQARQRAARDKALITFAYNVSAAGLYMRHGLYPRVPLYRMVAPAAVVARRIEGEAAGGHEAGPREGGSTVKEWMGRIDGEVLGFRRDAHHDFLFQADPGEAMCITRDGHPVGYCYISKAGQIGPFAIAPTADGRQAVGAALRQALGHHPETLSMIVPGPTDVLMRAATDFGFRVDEPLVLMAERSFGDWRCYMPRNPGHM